MTHPQYQPFDANVVPLEGSNLIEASAGTGKTYSIAILVLRLVVEEQLPVKEILMVTFTRAAVAELEDRIRLFIRTAYKASLGKPIDDANIEAIVNKAVGRATQNGVNGADRVRTLLREAVLFLDETSVLTIHSFCKQTLREFAFETGQLFGAETLPDMRPVVEAAINQYWRQHITTIDLQLLAMIVYPEMKGDIQQLVLNHLSGRHYLGYENNKDYAISAAMQARWLEQLAAAAEKSDRLKTELLDFVKAENGRLAKICGGDGNARRYLLPLLSVPEDFVTYIENKRSSAYIPKVVPDILQKIDAWRQVEQEGMEILRTVRQQLNGLAITEAEKRVRQYKALNNIVGYDDLINHLHSALVKQENPALETALRKKYKAVFIDEFQDTDRQQYELFHRAFARDTILFYIGDPKQSIYGWRKADIFTYFEARNAVRRVYGMNINFRSSAVYIAAMNDFFLPTEGFDTFFFTGEADSIDYIPVGSPRSNARGKFRKGTSEEMPLSIRTLPRDEIAHSAAAQVADILLNKDYTIGKDAQQRRVRPSDIGVLVRTGDQAEEIKASFSRLGIPAVTVNESKVLQSDEAGWLRYLLEAIEDPSRASINRALLSPFTRYTTENILQLDDEAVLTLFGNYRARWHEDGVYPALMDFVADFGVRHLLLQSHYEAGERVMTNLMQLAEIVHQVESRKSLSMIELISWLRRSIEGMVPEDDEFIQRVENDEDAVKIVTIHKSKGLEYSVVLAPFLEFDTGTRFEFVGFRDPATGDYFGAEKDRLTDEQRRWQQQQVEQENRRLLYVALTRAVYKAYIFRNEKGRASTLATFLDALANNSSSHIQYETGPIKAPANRYGDEDVPTDRPADAPVHFSLQEENWRRVSYTQLAARFAHAPGLQQPPAGDDYDNFVFKTLKKGGKTGELLHYLFENISFSNDSQWDKWIDEGIQRFAPAQRENYLPNLRRLLSEVLTARVRVGDTALTLSSVSRSRCITEFEFDFPVGRFRPDRLNSLSSPEMNVVVRDFRELRGKPLEGIMNGRMDLFFEQGGRYYILDWKSNHLGSTLDDYSTERLEEAMRENNYHLQYLIYTLAAKKYLESRLSGFDYDTQFGGVIYFFIRGVRSGSEQSIFTVRKPRSLLDKLDTILSDPA